MPRIIRERNRRVTIRNRIASVSPALSPSRSCRTAPRPERPVRLRHHRRFRPAHHDGPRIAECLKRYPGVHDAAVVLFYDRGGKHSLYAFVEGAGALLEGELREDLARNLREIPPPEQIQISSALPRDRGGAIRTEMLQLIASNQLDQVDQLTRDEDERGIIARVVAERRNFADKF